jgi:hypothetical protein
MQRLLICWRLYRDKHLAFTLARAWRSAKRLA